MVAPLLALSAAAEGLIALVASALAILVLRSSVRRSVNRAMAFWLLASAAGWIAGIVEFLSLDRFIEYDALLYIWSFGTLAMGAYTWFVSLALPTPLVRPLRSRAGRAGLIVLFGLLVVLPFAAPSWFIDTAQETFEPSWGWLWGVGPGGILVLVFGAAILLYAVVASIATFLAAPKGTIIRKRARAYAIAFGIGDVGTLLSVSLLAALPTSPHLSVLLVGIVSPTFSILELCLVAYALLKWQILDIDLKLKVSVSRGTVAAILVASFAVVAQIAQSLVGAAFGVLAGLAAVGALAFAAVPLNKYAERTMDRLMPGVDDTPEYRARRRAEIQRALIDDRFEVLRELGQGGQGRARLARDRDLDREVVLKEPKVVDDQARAKLLREARALARVKHPNVVAIYDVLSDAPTPTIVMEYMSGGTLSDKLAMDGRLSETSARKVAADVLQGLERLHHEGIVHRDVKPSNVFIDADGTAKIGDLGIAGLDHGGTPEFMSPEQARGDPVDLRSDVYAVGALLLASVTGHATSASTRDDRHPIIMAVGAPSAALSPALQGIVARAMARDPRDRFATADDMRRELLVG